MGIEYLLLEKARKRGEKIGEERGEKTALQLIVHLTLSIVAVSFYKKSAEFCASK